MCLLSARPDSRNHAADTPGVAPLQALLDLLPPAFAPLQALLDLKPPAFAPLQALVVLNDIQFVEAARVLAERVMSGTASAQAADVDHAGQIEHAFRLLTGRKPTGRERERKIRLVAVLPERVQAVVVEPPPAPREGV